MPKTGRSLVGMVAGFIPEWWPVFDRNGTRLYVGIHTMSRQSRIHQHPTEPAHGARRSAGSQARERGLLLGSRPQARAMARVTLYGTVAKLGGCDSLFLKRGFLR